MNSKLRSQLKGIGSKTQAVMQLGKNGIGEDFLAQVEQLLEAREILKISVLDNNMDDIKELSREISLKTESEVVQVIGRKIVLFKRNIKEPVLNLKI